MDDSAVAAALSVARAQGLRPREPHVLRAAWHVLVHLRPLPIVARVSSPLPFPEGPDPEGVAREVAVAAHCARAGAPVVPPADEVEPIAYRAGGHVVTFWRFIEPHDDPDPGAAGRALRAIHEALGDYTDSLPAMAHPEETRALIHALPDGDETELLRRVAERHTPLDGQALHGDAHLLNCLGTPAGPLWHDFETACSGPREYDLAALVAIERVVGGKPEAQAALDAYGAHDADLLDELVVHYVVWVTASMLVALPRRPELAEAVDRRLRWLRAI